MLAYVTVVVCQEGLYYGGLLYYFYFNIYLKHAFRYPSCEQLWVAHKNKTKNHKNNLKNIKTKTKPGALANLLRCPQQTIPKLYPCTLKHSLRDETWIVTTYPLVSRHIKSILQ